MTSRTKKTALIFLLGAAAIIGGKYAKDAYGGREAPQTRDREAYLPVVSEKPIEIDYNENASDTLYVPAKHNGHVDQAVLVKSYIDPATMKQEWRQIGLVLNCNR